MRKLEIKTTKLDTVVDFTIGTLCSAFMILLYIILNIVFSEMNFIDDGIFQAIGILILVLHTIAQYSVAAGKNLIMR